MYDVFISYRREGGHEMARYLYEMLRWKGISCFFDLEELGSGQFNHKLLSCIEQSSNFVLILSKDSLERCKNEGDWVRCEIEHAIAHNKNIVPFVLEGFSWPRDLPESLKTLPYYNNVQMMREYFDASIARLMSMLKITHKLSDVKETAAAPTVDSLLERAFMFLEDEEWKDAVKYSEKVLDIDPKNARGYLTRLCAEFKLKSMDEIAVYEGNLDSIKASKTYKKIEQFDTQLAREIDALLSKNIENRSLSVYDQAVSAMQGAKTKEELADAAKLFESIASYKDSASLAEECRSKIEQIREEEREEALRSRYNSAVNMLNAAKSKEALLRVASLFDELSAYKDSAELAKQCRDKVEEMRLREEQARLDRYNEALRKMSEAKTVADYDAAINDFFASNGYKDSAKLIGECRMYKQIIREQAAEEAKKLWSNTQAYNKALLAMQEAKTNEDFRKAGVMFFSLGGFKDSMELSKQCLSEATKRSTWEETYTKAESMFINAKTKEDYVKVAQLYASMEGYMSANERLAKCNERIKEFEKAEEQARFVASLSVGNVIHFGKYDWRVLAKDGGKALLLSERGIMLPEKRSSTTVWEDSSERHWLNNCFLKEAFSDAEWEKILTTTTEPRINDKIFSLSVDEVKKYLSPEAKRKCASKCKWWLRSGLTVMANGTIHEYNSLRDSFDIYMRPAMWVDFSK